MPAAWRISPPACRTLRSKLMQAFWPGPLTLILPRRPGVGAAAAGGQDSIGLRCPSHPVAQALLQACAALGRAGPGGTQRQPVWPRQPDHGRACAGRIWRRPAGARRRRLRGGHRVHHHRLHPWRAGAAAPRRHHAARRSRRRADCALRCQRRTRGARTPRLRHAGVALRAARPGAPDGRAKPCRAALDRAGQPTRPATSPSIARAILRHVPAGCCAGACPTTPPPRRSSCLPCCANLTPRASADLDRDAARRRLSGKACATGCSAPRPLDTALARRR